MMKGVCAPRGSERFKPPITGLFEEVCVATSEVVKVHIRASTVEGIGESAVFKRHLAVDYLDSCFCSFAAE